MSNQQVPVVANRKRDSKRSTGCVLAAVGAFVVLVLGSFGVSVLTGQTHLPTWIGGDGDPADIRVSSVDVDYTVRPNGTVHVVRTLKYDFNGVKRHGPAVSIAERGRGDDLEHDVVFGVTNLKVTSPTGAPAGYTTERDEDGRTLTVLVGDEDTKVTGEQTYVVSYDTRNLDERGSIGFQLEDYVVDADLDAPVAKVTGRVKAPAAADDAYCGSGCTARVGADGSVTYAADGLDRHDTVRLSVDYPSEAASAIDVPEQRTVPNGYQRPGEEKKTADWWAWALAGLFVAIGLARLLQVLVLRLDRRPGRSDGGPRLVDGTVVQAAGQPLAAPFTTGVTLDGGEALDLPGVSPALAAAVVRRRANRAQGIATLLDLAVRGYVEIIDHFGDPHVPDKQRWTIRARGDMDTSELAEHETALLTALRSSGGVSLPKDGGSMSRAYAAVTAPATASIGEAGWLRRKLPGQRGRWTWIWALVLVAAGGLMLWLNLEYGLGNSQIMALGGLAGGALLIAAAYVGAGRRAAGSVVAARAEALRDGLAAATADRLRYRDGVDLYGGFLPWAVLFGQEARWLDVCDQLALAGRLEPPPWYAGGAAPGVDLSSGSNLRALVAALRAAVPERRSSSSSARTSSSSSSGGGGSSGGSW